MVGREDSGKVTLFDGLEQTAGHVNIFLRHTFCPPIEPTLCYLKCRPRGYSKREKSVLSELAKSFVGLLKFGRSERRSD